MRSVARSLVGAVHGRAVRPRCIKGGRERLACQGLPALLLAARLLVVFALVCTRSSGHLQWFVSVHLGIQQTAVAICCAPPSATQITAHREGVKQVRPCWVAHGRLTRHGWLVLVVASVTATATDCVWAYAMPMLQF